MSSLQNPFYVDFSTKIGFYPFIGIIQLLLDKKLWFSKKIAFGRLYPKALYSSLRQPGCRGLSAVDPWFCVAAFR
jgi:hypothetical protein